MELGMIGLGRMGANLVRRLLRDGHRCAVHDLDASAVAALADEGAVPTTDLAELVEALSPPRVLWVMVPAGHVDGVLDQLVDLVGPGDVVVDGGNSYYRDDVRRAEALGQRGIHYVDCGTSGGVWGLERGYCLMLGGEAAVVERLEPIWRSLAPHGDDTAVGPGAGDREGTAHLGYLHCGPVGAGHFVKMVHNGVEYGMMAALAEGLSILRHADAGLADRSIDAETAPMREPWFYRYELDVAAVAEVWRHGSVVRSWLLDLAADALAASPDLAAYGGVVADSGEGRWTVIAAIDEGVPASVIGAALHARFESNGGGRFAAQVLSALRSGFGGHHELGS